MPVNDKILVTDYNNIRNKVIGVLGPGSGTSGYGQTLSSSAVSLSSRVTINEYTLLRNDIINAYRHIFGFDPTLATPSVGNTVRFSTTFTPSVSDSPYTQYDQYADQIIANRFTVHPSQSITVNKGTRSRSTWDGGYWNSALSLLVTVTFTNSTQARYFFNSGGEIRFASSRTGGSVTAQNSSWTSLLSSAGTQAFGGNKPQQGVPTLNGGNFYRLTNNFQPWYQISASSYSNNTYRIQARSNVSNNSSGTANVIEFLVEWLDSYADPGFPSETDRVDGEMSLSVSTLEASGVLVPVGSGNFSVESPTVNLGNIIQATNSTSYGINPNVTAINEGSSVTMTVRATRFGSGTLYWTVESVSGTINTFDFVTAVSGSVSVVNDAGSFDITAREDFTTEGNESFIVRLRSESISGPILATSSQISIIDTSRTRSITVFPGFDITVSEGDGINFGVSTQNIPPGTVLNWSAFGESPRPTSSSDFVGGVISGTVTINNNGGSFLVTVLADRTDELNEIFRVVVSDPTTGVFGVSGRINVIDTSFR